jgi:AraC-like DNA-binding protein
VATLSGGFVIIVTSARLFLHPEILYGLEVRTIDTKKEHVVIPGSPNGQNSSQSSKDKELEEKLNGFMLQSKKFLQHKYSITNLSTDLQIPSHQLSNFLNQHLSTSYIDFINRFRVEYCIERIKNGDAQRLTLEALSLESGFNNRNSFTTAFKKLTGLTPSEFLRGTSNKADM